MIDYRADIDGLRAIAILTVVAYHVGFEKWSGGFVGVDVFFVISGFLITSLLLGERRESGRIALADFYARRVRRLLPAMATVLVAVLIAGALTLGRLNGEEQTLAKSAIAALLLNSNHYFSQISGGYFSLPAEALPLLHFWSLSLEEQFYLIWPVSLAALLGAARDVAHERRAFRTLLVVTLLSFALCLGATWRWHSASFFLMPARAWELGVGACLAFLPRRRPRPRDGLVGGAVAGFGLSAITLSVVLFDRATPFPGMAATLPVLGAAATIFGNSLSPSGLPCRLLSARPLVWIGLLSYSWYLWHWPLISLARSMDLGARDLPRDAFLGGAVGLALAYATHRWVERPCRRSAALLRRPARFSLYCGLGLTLAGLLLAGSIGAVAKFGRRSPEELRLLAARADLPPLNPLCNNALEQPVRLPDRSRCVVPSDAATVEAVLWGDSMADHWMPAFAAAAQQSGHSVLQLTRDACPPVLGVEIVNRDPTQPGRCLEFQSLAMAEIERLRAEAGLETVVLSSSWSLESSAGLKERLRATLRRLTAAGLNVVLLGPTPRLPFRVPDCLLRGDEARCAESRAEFDSRREPILEVFEESSRGLDHIRVVDPAPLLCDRERCPPTRGGVILYRDTHHLTARSAAEYAGFVAGVLGWAAVATTTDGLAPERQLAGGLE